MKKVYIAASFYYEDRAKTSKHKYIIEKVVERIKAATGVLANNFEFYIPHQLKIENAWDMSLEDWSKAVYDKDMTELESADIVVFLSFGKENNAGSVFEVGYICGLNKKAKTKQKLVVVKMTDEPESLMVTNACDTIITDSDIETYDWIKLPAQKTILEKIT